MVYFLLSSWENKIIQNRFSLTGGNSITLHEISRLKIIGIFIRVLLQMINPDQLAGFGDVQF